MIKSTKGIDTVIEDRQSLYLEGPQAFMGTIVKAVYGESSKSGTPGMQVIIVKNGVEGFKATEKDFPLGGQFNSEKFSEKVNINGPMSVTTWWITEATMDISKSYSVIQKVMLMADNLGLRQQLDEGVNENMSAKDFVDLFNKLFSGKKGAFLIQKVIDRYVKDGVVQERASTELWPWGVFVMASEVMDLQMKIDKDPKNFVVYNDGEGVKEALAKTTESNEETPDLTF